MALPNPHSTGLGYNPKDSLYLATFDASWDQLTMPFYEYQCQACDHHVEVLQKISEAPLTVCPACGQPSLKRLVSPAGFRLKGTGWYETDFKGHGKKPSSDSKDGDSGTKPPADQPAEKKDSGQTDNTPSGQSGDSKAA